VSKTLDRVEENIANVTEVIEDDQATKILDWLSPIDYGTEQSDFLDKRQQGTGQWLLNSGKFQHWYKNRGQILLFQGIPGAGKTIMAAAVNDYIGNKQRSDSDLGLAFVFCNFRRKHQQKPINILASILKQLARQDKRVLKEVKSLHARHTKMKTQPLQTEVHSALGTVGDCFRQTYVVIDALEETQIPRKQLLVFLSELFRIQKRIGLNLLVTSRISPDIERLFVQRKAGLLEIRATDDDVRIFVEGNISQLPSFVTESTVKTITEQILRAADGM
jgi:DNA polymerase III delta prime subunit